jgi:hypothetical protein
MGSKGSQTSQTNQTQTYNPAGAGYIQNALQQGQAAAQNAFAQPVAPVAGFSQDQQNAFGTVRNAQGMAQPYYNQAANLFGQSAQAPNVSQFFNPYAGAVAGNMMDLFGQQNSQNTGQLTQAAGGVGADRIAVGQSELAKQQGQAFGQTMAGVYAPSLQASLQEQGVQQGAGQDMASLGTAAQNAAFQGAQQQYGMGQQQQQLQQAQLNAPYQNTLARLAYPFQTAQFNAGITGALAPGLGGTTTGQGNTQSQFNPSIFGQIGGGLQALAGPAGYLSGSGKGSNPSYGMGNGVYGGNSANPLPGLSASDYGPGFARGGVTNPYDRGEDTVVPDEQLHAIAPHVPQLNLNPPQQPSGGNGGGVGIGDIAKIAMMFANRGGAVRNPYASGGAASFDERFSGDGGDDDVVNPGDPIRMPDQAAVENWRNGADDDAMSFAPTNGTPPSPARAAVMGAGAGQAAAPAAHIANPYAGGSDDGPSLAGFLSSPYAALTAGGLDAMRTGSLASGFGTTMKLASGQREAAQKDESLDQAVRRLQQEAQFHQDQYTKMTPYQQATIDVKKQELASDDTSEVAGTIADAIKSGTQPPTLTGLYGKSAAVRAKLGDFDLGKAQLEWERAKKQVSTLNGPQMTRFVGLAGSVDKTIDEVKSLSEQMQNSGIPLLNRAKLAAYMQTEGNSPRGQLAARYIASVNTLKEEFANLANGGYAPTEAAWHLANQQINGDYGVKQLGASLNEVQRLIRYRVQSIPGLQTMGAGAPNRYTGQGGSDAPAAPAAAAPESKTINGKNYIKQNGQWFQQ